MSSFAPSSLRLLITGGAGFIGAELVKYMVRNYPHYHVYNLDALTYAGDLARLEGLDAPNYTFIRADLSDQSKVDALFSEHKPEAVIHLAAETHVDRSIRDPVPFLRSNVEGTLYLLEAARQHWQPITHLHRFYHISTDEVYGSLGAKGSFREESPYRPRSPYAATKASSDHLVHAYANTYQLPVLMSHCSNNYGPFQYPEKLIPLAVLHLLEERPVPMYDQGQHIREWLHLSDHIAAIDHIFHKAERGAIYNISSGEETTNKALLHSLAEGVAERRGRSPSALRKLIQPSKDRPGHDFRYAMNGTKLRQQLGWKPRLTLSNGLAQTIDWYLDHQDWLRQARK